MTNQPPVLIVGAGPTGLMMACELARHGIAFRIIDKKHQSVLSSNATLIQTRTLELFDHLGIADRFIRAGNPCHAINLYVKGESLIKIPLKYLDTAFPFILMLPQSETEKTLIHYLSDTFKKNIEWEAELLDLKENGNDVTVLIRHRDRNTEETKFDWVIACDGSHSIVREKSHIASPGEDIPEQFIVADANIQSFMSKDEIHLYFGKETLFAAFPLGANKYRISANLNLDYKRKIFTEREVIEMAQERAYGSYYVKNVSWISPYWIHSKVVNKLHHGRIFLAGDAAHVHVPIAGQGMNSGIQDAYNLAWKLALVIKGKASSALLESYDKERLPVVKRIVKHTVDYSKLALFDRKFISKLRKFADKLKHDPKVLSKKIGKQLTQLSIHYTQSPVIDYSSIKGNALKQGKRAPDVAINATTKLYDHLHNIMHNVLIFTGEKLGKTKIMRIKELQKKLTKINPELVKVHVVAREKIPQINNFIYDEEGEIHKAFHAKVSVVYLLRPDNYIAYITKNFDNVGVEKLLKKYLE